MAKPSDHNKIKHSIKVHKEKTQPQNNTREHGSAFYAREKLKMHR